MKQIYKLGILLMLVISIAATQVNAVSRHDYFYFTLTGSDNQGGGIWVNDQCSVLDTANVNYGYTLVSSNPLVVLIWEYNLIDTNRYVNQYGNVVVPTKILNTSIKEKCPTLFGISSKR